MLPIYMWFRALVALLRLGRDVKIDYVSSGKKTSKGDTPTTCLREGHEAESESGANGWSSSLLWDSSTVSFDTISSYGYRVFIVQCFDVLHSCLCNRFSSKSFPSRGFENNARAMLMPKVKRKLV